MTNDLGRKHAIRTSWPLLVFGLVAATLLPIGIHTVMLDSLGIPYPADFPRSGWASLPDQALRVFATFILCTQLRASFSLPSFARLLIVFLAVAALNEELLRLPIMRNMVSSRWTIYPFVDNLPHVLRYAVLAIVVSAFSRVALSASARAIAALAIAACMTFAIGPWLDSIFTTVIAGNAKLEGDQLYNVPYDWQVNLPSYLTYTEPAVAALLLAWLLAQGRRSAMSIAAVIFGLRAGPLFGVMLNILYGRSGAMIAMLSKGQFALESAALALIAAAVMTRAQAPSAVRVVCDLK